MFRASLLSLVLVCLAAPRASADCASTCGDVCFAVPESAFVRVEVLSTTDGYSSHVRIVEQLGGSPAITVTPGDELDGIYSQIPLVVGDDAFITISRFNGGTEQTVWNTAWPIRDELVICSGTDPNVPLDKYVLMASDPDCAAIADDFEIANTCDGDWDGGGCTAASGSPGLLLGLLAFARRRRRRRH
jgi:hypothetical protein